VPFIGRRRVGSSSNASVLGKREEGAAPISEGERSIRDD
jgi:hypothetical protein